MCVGSSGIGDMLLEFLDREGLGFEVGYESAVTDEEVVVEARNREMLALDGDAEWVRDYVESLLPGRETGNQRKYHRKMSLSPPVVILTRALSHNVGGNRSTRAHPAIMFGRMCKYKTPWPFAFVSSTIAVYNAPQHNLPPNGPQSQGLEVCRRIVPETKKIEDFE